MVSVIWDWNGTLLNDLGHCIASINILLKKRNLPALDDAHYREVFSFPVKEYYQKIGFDFTKEDFAIPAKEFIDIYDQNIESCGLHNHAKEVLSYFHEKGARQFVLSAMRQNMLELTLKHNDIFDFFEGVAGLNDHYAVSKIERGRQLIDQFKINKDECFIIGDTNHDFEVAQEIGIKCILIADGHQSERRLRETGATVLQGLTELLNTSEISQLFSEF
jgi:phosphoglycolate phosphatase